MLPNVLAVAWLIGTAEPTTRRSFIKEKAGSHMSAIPQSNSWAPSYSANASYISSTAASSGASRFFRWGPEVKESITMANFTFDTLLPIVMIDNYRTVEEVICHDYEEHGDLDNRVVDLPTATIRFSKTIEAENAYQSWQPFLQKELTMFIGHEWKCIRREVALLTITKMVLRQSTIDLVVYPRNWSDVLKEYQVSVTRYTNTVAMNYNYNALSRTSSTKIIPLYASKYATITCIDCYYHGDVTFAFVVAGNPVGITSYELEMQGNIKLNMDTEIKVFEPIRAEQGELKTLMKRTLTLISIPGFFTVEPGFQLIAGANFTSFSNESVSLRSGFEVVIPLNRTLVSTRRHNSQRDNPEVTSATNFTRHNPVLGNITLGIQAKSTMVMSPEFGISVSILSTSFSAYLGFDNTLNIDLLVSKGVPFDEVTYNITRKHDVTVDMEGVFGNGRRKVFNGTWIEVACKSCVLCTPCVFRESTFLPLAPKEFTGLIIEHPLMDK